MDAREALEVIKSYLVDDFDVPAEKVKLDADLFEDLELDSIDALDMVGLIEAKLGAQIEDEAIKNLRTISDVVDFVVMLSSRDQ